MKDAMSINNNQLCTVPRAYLWSVPMCQCLLLFCPFASIFCSMSNFSWILKLCKKFPPLNTPMHSTIKKPQSLYICEQNTGLSQPFAQFWKVFGFCSQQSAELGLVCCVAGDICFIWKSAMLSTAHCSHGSISLLLPSQGATWTGLGVWVSNKVGGWRQWKILHKISARGVFAKCLWYWILSGSPAEQGPAVTRPALSPAPRSWNPIKNFYWCLQPPRAAPPPASPAPSQCSVQDFLSQEN